MHDSKKSYHSVNTNVVEGGTSLSSEQRVRVTLLRDLRSTPSTLSIDNTNNQILSEGQAQ